MVTQSNIDDICQIIIICRVGATSDAFFLAGNHEFATTLLSVEYSTFGNCGVF